MKTFKGLVVIATLLLAVGCASSGDDGEASLLSASTEQGSTTDFDVSIDQVNHPTILGDQDTIDLRYQISVRNQSAVPVSLRRIALTSSGSAPLRLAGNARQFNQVIAPGASETVEYWATALVTDFTQGNRLPMTVRIRTVFREGEGKERSETFLRRVTADYNVGLAQ